MIQHQDLSAGRWQKMHLLEQLSHIGSEVERALHWRAKNNVPYSQKAVERALELVDFTLECTREFSRLKELARIREALADYFCGNNQYQSSENSWQKYFLYFAIAFRNSSGAWPL